MSEQGGHGERLERRPRGVACRGRALRAIGAGALAVAGAAVGRAQEQTLGVTLASEAAYPGYTLFAPMTFPMTYLVDNEGKVVNSWRGDYLVGSSVYLLEGGRLLRTATLGPSDVFTAAGGGGRIEVVDWDNELEWAFDYDSATARHHHDVAALPGGNVLLIAWELKTRAEALAAGRDPSLLSEGALHPLHVVEIEPDGAGSASVVWEWHVWDHLIQDRDPTRANYGPVADHPELMDVNYLGLDALGRADWLHTNGIAYAPDLDQIIVSLRQISEVWVIDHSTTTAEAASHTGGRQGRGGDLLYRWGNPEAYRAGSPADQRLFQQHDAQWVAPGAPGAGHLLVFNNGAERRPPRFSEVDEIEPPVDPSGGYDHVPGLPYEPADSAWSYRDSPPEAFFASFISGAQRLPNGNTLVTAGPQGRLFEVDPEGEPVWEYLSPVDFTGPLEQGETVPGVDSRIFKARRYGADHPGLAGRDLTPGAPVELYTLLRNDEVRSLDPVTPGLDTIFTGSGLNALDPADDGYLTPFAPADPDPAPELCVPGPALAFYELANASYELYLAKAPDAGSRPCGLRVLY